MREKGIEFGVIFGIVLVDMYVKNGVLGKVMEVFNSM